MIPTSQDSIDRAMARDRAALPKQDSTPPPSLQPSLHASSIARPVSGAGHTIASTSAIAPFKIVLVACFSIAAGAVAIYVLPTPTTKIVRNKPASEAAKQFIPDAPPTPAPYSAPTLEQRVAPTSHIAGSKSQSQSSADRSAPTPEVTPNGTLLTPTTPPKTYTRSKATLQIRDRDSTIK